jgi:hypothetical protein
MPMMLDSCDRGLHWCSSMRSYLLVVFIACALLSGCGRPSLTTEELLQQLTARGVEAQVLGPTYAPLNIRGTRVHISSPAFSQPAEIQVYEDPARQVQVKNDVITTQTPAGTTTVDIMRWPYPFHVFQQGPLLVIYVGDDQGVLDLLTKILGTQAAGP